METWLENIKENRRPKTYVQYRSNVEKYIYPVFGDTRLRDLQPILIEKYLNSLRAKGVGDRTTQILYSHLHAALASAVKKGLIGRNPMDAVARPRVRNPKKILTLDADQVQKLLIAADGSWMATLIYLAISTAMREAEIIGLMWQDIDFQRNRLKVQRQVQRIYKQGLVFCPPKTDAGMRIIALGQSTIDRLSEHRREQEIQKKLAGVHWIEMDLVFPNSIGKPLEVRRVLNEFHLLLEKAGLPRLRFHDLRHTSITLLLNDVGVPIKEAQHRAGHTRASTTLDIYGGSATSKLDEIAAQALDDLITPIKVEWHPNGTEKVNPNRK